MSLIGQTHFTYKIRISKFYIPPLDKPATNPNK